MHKVIAAMALSVAVLASTAAGIPASASCVGPALPGHAAHRIASGVTITGTDGSNGIGRGDIYACHNGAVTVH